MGEEQKGLALRSVSELQASKRFTGPIVTPVRKAGEFYRAEEYHQDYYKKNPLRYRFYRARSGRDKFLKKAWAGYRRPVMAGGKYGRPDNKEISERLTPLQYEVTQRDGTERPFANEYWDNKGEGIYIDIVSGEPLFSSADKFVSGTGWPSFTSPIEPDNIVTREDRKLFSARTEVRSSHAGLALRTPLRGRPGADRAPLLHKLRLFKICTEGGARRAGVWRVSEALRVKIYKN